MSDLLREQMEGFRPLPQNKVTRSGASYQQTLTWTVDRLSMLVESYQRQESHNQTTQLIRQDFDTTLRFYHEYCIKGYLGAHYRECGLRPGTATEFEHVIPERVVREAVFAGRITIDQALECPTCQLSREKHRLLNKLGMKGSTPDPFWFWRRYQPLDVAIETRDGQSIDLNQWNLADHYRLFLLKNQ